MLEEAHLDPEVNTTACSPSVPIQAVCGHFDWIVLSLWKLLISVTVVSPRPSSSKVHTGKDTDLKEF